MPAKMPVGYRLQMKLVKLYAPGKNSIHYSRESIYCNKKIEVAKLPQEAQDMFNRFMQKVLQPEVLNT